MCWAISCRIRSGDFPQSASRSSWVAAERGAHHNSTSSSNPPAASSDESDGLGFFASIAREAHPVERFAPFNARLHVFPPSAVL